MPMHNLDNILKILTFNTSATSPGEISSKNCGKHYSQTGGIVGRIHY
jgi:hypothetical protein